MTPTDVWLIVVIVVSTILASFLAMAETALTRINRAKAMALEDEGRRWSKQLVRLVEHPERFLNPVLLLMLLAHLVIASVVAVLIQRHFGSGLLFVATLVETAVIFVFAEAAPKTWAIEHPDRSALLSAPLVAGVVGLLPIRVITRGLIGVTNVVLPGKGLKRGPFVSEQELLAMADQAEEEDVIESQERALIHSIIHFGDTVVREVMVPRPDMVSVEALAGGDVRVNARMPIDELNELLDTELPEGDWDTVGGLVYNLLGHVPVEGETVEFDGHRLRAEKVQGRRIGRVRVTRLATAERNQEQT